MQYNVTKEYYALQSQYDIGYEFLHELLNFHINIGDSIIINNMEINIPKVIFDCGIVNIRIILDNTPILFEAFINYNECFCAFDIIKHLRTSNIKIAHDDYMKYEYLFKSINIFYNYILNNGSIDTNAYLKPCYNINYFCCDISIKCPYVYILFNSNWRANIFNIIHASILEIIFTGEMYHHDIVYKNTLFHEINNNCYVRILIINSIHGFNANIAKNILNAFPEIIFLLVRSIKGDDFTHIPININSTKKLYCSKNYTNNISDISELSCIFDTYSSVYNVEKLLIKYNFINNKLIKNANKF